MNQKEAGKAKIIFGLAGIILILDQIIKLIVLNNLKQSITVIPNFFYLSFVKNTGAGFGIFKDQNTLLIFISVIILGAILFYYDKFPKNTLVYSSIGLIIGGAIGNLMDRIRLGFVVDYISFSIWPAFNIADSAISIGAILLIIYFWRAEGKKR